MTYFKDKTVLITGSFGGFGRHFTSQLKEAGAKLILSDLAVPSDQSSIDQDRIINVFTADLSTAKGCSALYEDVTATSGIPDVIIHNAGIAYIGAFTDIPLDRNEKVISINLLSVMRLNSLFLPKMIQRKSGHLIYVCSVAGFVSTPYGVSYSSSKFGLRSMAMATHGENRRHGIRTSITYPFWSKTPIMKSQVFGKPDMKTMPDFFASDPALVVRHTLQGVAKGKLHIRPDFFSRVMWQAVRFLPVIAPQRHMKHDLTR